MLCQEIYLNVCYGQIYYLRYAIIWKLIIAIPAVSHCPLKDRLSKIFFALSTVNDVDIQNIPEHNVYKSLDYTNTTTS